MIRFNNDVRRTAAVHCGKNGLHGIQVGLQVRGGGGVKVNAILHVGKPNSIQVHRDSI